MPNTQSALRRAAWIAAGLALCVGAGVWAQSRLGTLDGGGARLVAALGEATGLRIETRGAGEIALFPTPHLRVTGVSLAYGGETPFAAARELIGSLDVSALAAGRIEISEITLVQPEIALDRVRIGEALRGVRRSGAAGTPPALRLKDGRLTMAGRVVDRVEAGLVWPREGGPLAVSGFGRFAGRPVEATFQLSDLGAFARGERAPFRARMEGGGARLMFDGEAIDSAGPSLVGRISARAPSLGDTLAWIGVGGKRSAGPQFSLSLTGGGVLDAQGLSVSNAELDLSGDSFMGAGRLTTTSDGRPSVEATVDAGAIDMRRYAAVLAPEILREGGGWSTAAIDLGGLKGWTLDLRLSMASVTLGRFALGQTAATVAVAGGGLDLSVGEAEAYGGSLGGRLSLEPDPRGVRMKLEGAATEIALDEALHAVMKDPPLSGAVTGDVAVEGAGASTADFVASLKGQASGHLADGALERISRSRTLALAGLGRRMDVSRADARVRIAGGVAQAEDISIIGSDAVFGLAGPIRLVERTVDLTGHVKPTSGGWALPVSLEGPLDSPKLRPNLADRTPRGEARRDVAHPSAN